VRLMIEARYHRVPKQHVYTGEIVISEDGVPNCLTLPFEEVEMSTIATDLHHVVRLVMSRAEEICVRVIQKSHQTGRTVPMDLPHDQVNRIYQSPGEARRFFMCE
jgi:hypothetical protein